jgi:hypothetical protein
MASSESNLIEELMHNSSASGNRMLERRMADLAVWFYKNKGSIPTDNLAARQRFLEKAFWIMIEINALQTERIHELEASKKGASRLWMPRGIAVNGREEFS